MTSYPILRQPDFNKTFWLKTHASSVAIVTARAQSDEKNHQYVISYDSRMFKGYEKKSSVWLPAFLVLQLTDHIWLGVTLNSFKIKEHFNS